MANVEEKMKNIGPLPRLNFCANLSFQFQEHASMLDRYTAARDAGFTGVEVAFPYDLELSELVKVKRECQLEQILINAFPGDLGAGDLGLAAIPGREAEFEESLKVTFQFVDALQCKCLHIMSGKTLDLDRTECAATLERNLRHILPELEKRSVIGLIEPINSVTIPGYYLNDFDEAIAIVQKINSPFIRLQMDIFHLQHIHGNLTNRIKQAVPYTGHIQIAQVPDRHEPDSLGEIDYQYLLLFLQTLKYRGWIGLEYKPLETTEKGLQWIKKLGFKLPS